MFVVVIYVRARCVRDCGDDMVEVLATRCAGFDDPGRCFKCGEMPRECSLERVDYFIIPEHHFLVES